jgi:hypothetical protein
MIPIFLQKKVSNGRKNVLDFQTFFQNFIFILKPFEKEKNRVRIKRVLKRGRQFLFGR